MVSSPVDSRRDTERNGRRRPFAEDKWSFTACTILCFCINSRHRCAAQSYTFSQFRQGCLSSLLHLRHATRAQALYESDNGQLRMKQREAGQKQWSEWGVHRPLLPQEVGHAWKHIHIAALQDGEGRQRAVVHEAVNGLQLACEKSDCVERGGATSTSQVAHIKVTDMARILCWKVTVWVPILLGQGGAHLLGGIAHQQVPQPSSSVTG